MVVPSHGKMVAEIDNVLLLLKAETAWKIISMLTYVIHYDG
jgi:hypothetical protein